MKVETREGTDRQTPKLLHFAFVYRLSFFFDTHAGSVSVNTLVTQFKVFSTTLLFSPFCFDDNIFDRTIASVPAFTQYTSHYSD